MGCVYNSYICPPVLIFIKFPSSDFVLNFLAVRFKVFLLTKQIKSRYFFNLKIVFGTVYLITKRESIIKGTIMISETILIIVAQKKAILRKKISEAIE